MQGRKLDVGDQPRARSIARDNLSSSFTDRGVQRTHQFYPLAEAGNVRLELKKRKCAHSYSIEAFHVRVEAL